MSFHARKGNSNRSFLYAVCKPQTKHQKTNDHGLAHCPPLTFFIWTGRPNLNISLTYSMWLIFPIEWLVFILASTLKKCALQGLWNLDWFRCSQMYLETSLIHGVFLSDELGRNSANYGKRKVAKFPDGKNNIYRLEVKQTLHWIRRRI